MYRICSPQRASMLQSCSGQGGQSTSSRQAGSAQWCMTCGTLRGAARAAHSSAAPSERPSRSLALRPQQLTAGSALSSKLQMIYHWHSQRGQPRGSHGLSRSCTARSAQLRCLQQLQSPAAKSRSTSYAGSACSKQPAADSSSQTGCARCIGCSLWSQPACALQPSIAAGCALEPAGMQLCSLSVDHTRHALLTSLTGCCYVTACTHKHRLHSQTACRACHQSMYEVQCCSAQLASTLQARLAKMP